MLNLAKIIFKDSMLQDILSDTADKYAVPAEEAQNDTF